MISSHLKRMESGQEIVLQMKFDYLQVYISDLESVDELKTNLVGFQELFYRPFHSLL